MIGSLVLIASLPAYAADNLLWTSLTLPETSAFSLHQEGGTVYQRFRNRRPAAHVSFVMGHFDVGACNDTRGEHIALTGHQGEAPGLLYASNNTLTYLPLDSQPVSAAAGFLKDERCHFAVALENGDVVLSDGTAAGSVPIPLVAPVHATPDRQRGLLIAADQGRVVVGDAGGLLVAYDLQSGKSDIQLIDAPAVPGAVFSASGDALWVISERGSLYLYAPFSGKALERRLVGEHPVSSGLTPWTGEHHQGLAWGTLAGEVFLYDGDNLRRLYRGAPVVWPILTLSEPQHGMHLVVASRDEVRTYREARPGLDGIVQGGFVSVPLSALSGSHPIDRAHVGVVPSPSVQITRRGLGPMRAPRLR